MKALVAGSTGLVGSHLVTLLTARPQVSTVRALVRRPTETNDSKLQTQVTNFDALNSLQLSETFDVAFCTLGTTIKKAKSKEAFAKVDLEYVVEFAKLAKRSGVRHFLVVSSLGANPTSPVFYSATKGKMEEALREIGFERLTIVRPSLLLGERNERRFGEDIAQRLAPFAKPFLFGTLKKYRPVEASSVARALFELATQDACSSSEGIEVLSLRAHL